MELQRFSRVIAILFFALAGTAAGKGDTRAPPRARGASLTPAAAAALDRLNAIAEQPFHALVSPLTGAASAVLGGALAVDASAGAAPAVRGLLAAFPELFAFDARWSVDVAPRPGRPDGAHAVRVSFAGIEIANAGGHVVLDGGRLTGTALTLPGAADVLGGFDVAPSAATAAARDAVEELHRRRGRTAAIRWRAPRFERRWLATADGLVPVIGVDAGSTDGESFGVFVDARDGAVRRIVELTDRGAGDGKYPNSGSFLPFDTTIGKGKVFKNWKAARNNTTSSEPLDDVGQGVPAMSIPDGLLVGAFADMWSDTGGTPISPNYSYSFAPNGLNRDLFDQVNAYYHITRFARHLEDVLGRDVATDFALPIVCNIQSAQPNAFFTATLFPAGGHVTGWMGFHDLTLFLGPKADLARDPTVVAHEYVHAWLHFEGLAFDGVLDDPSRAVNEAVADWFSLAFHKDTTIGRYVEDVFGAGIARDLQDDDHFPETTLDAMALTGDLPEEHRNGEIFGSFLMDVSQERGAAPIEVLLFDALPFMPHDTAAAGFPVVDVNNAVDATEAFFSACVAAFATSVYPGDDFNAIVAAAAARGLANVPGSMEALGTDLELSPDLSARFASRFVRSGDVHEYFFQVDPLRTLAVTLKGGKGVEPDFTITDLSGNPALTETLPKSVLKKGRLVKQEGLVPLLTALDLYKVTVTSPSGDVGTYTLTLQAQ